MRKGSGNTRLAIDIFFDSDVTVVDCHYSLLDYYGWIKVVLRYKEMCDLKKC